MPEKLSLLEWKQYIGRKKQDLCSHSRTITTSLDILINKSADLKRNWTDAIS